MRNEKLVTSLNSKTMAENKNNLKLWNSVEKTNPDDTKEVQVGAYKYTSVDTYSRIKEATKQFGVFGEGWGVVGESFDCEKVQGLCIYTASLFWWNANQHIIPIKSAIVTHQKKAIWENRKRTDKFDMIPDEDFPKKVSTDALTKGLSMLGFNADVYMGKFEDDKYVAEQRKISAEVTNERLVQLDYELAACTTAPDVTVLYQSLERNEKVNKTVLEKFSARTAELKPSV